MDAKGRLTIKDIINKKSQGEKIVMLTAYDYPFASLVDQVGVDIVLVGDSLANVVLGHGATTDVTMDEMIIHACAVNRAVKNALLVGDMPFESYQKDISKALENAKRFIDSGCDAVKLEWFDRCLDATESIIKAGIPVMGHIGLTPQTAEKLGGFKVQGKDAESAEKIIERAIVLQEKGCFSVVLECIPDVLAKKITEKISIPTISCGAGVSCDGQVLVIHDILGLSTNVKPKFVKQYTDIKPFILGAVEKYCSEVRNGTYPDKEHSYSMEEKEAAKLK